MAKTKRYYWLKLPKDFFKQKAIKKLRGIAGGDTYTVIYLKLALLSISDGGKLYFDGIENDFAAELALELDEEVENVKITINYLQSVGLLEYIEEDEMILTAVPSMVGSETDKAGLMRANRARKRIQENADSNNVTPALPQRYTEIEIELEKDTDIEEKREEKKTDSDESVHPPSSDVKSKKGKKSKKPKAPEPEKKAYGEFQNVFLTDDELEKLKSKYSDYQERIERLSAGIESKGYKYKSHYATIISWANSDSKKSGRKEPEPKWMTKSAENYNSYSQRQYSTEELDKLEQKLTGVKTAGTDPEIAARAEALKQQLS